MCISEKFNNYLFHFFGYSVLFSIILPCAHLLSKTCYSPTFFPLSSSGDSPLVL